MLKKTFAVLLVVASMGLVAMPLLAHGKRCCSGVKTADAAMRSCKACPHKAAMKNGFAALKGDLAKMEKGVPEADVAVFLKAHQAHLEKVLDNHRACMKDCPMTKAAMKSGCPYAEAMQSAFNALEKDEAQIRKGIPKAEQASFLKAHESNLKKLFDTQVQCTKKCPVKGARRTGEKV
jgi:hypothetical protein